MKRILVALLLGILSFFLFFLIGEWATNSLGEAGFLVMFLFMGAYFFICQRRLSRGIADAPRKDWPIMLALNAGPLVHVILMVVGKQKWPVILVQGPIFLISGWGGAFAGAVVASRAARKRQGAQ